MRKRYLYSSILASLLSCCAQAAPVNSDPTLAIAIARTPISYAQLLAETVQFENADIVGTAIYAKSSDTAPLDLIAKTGRSAAGATDPAVVAAAKSGKPTEAGSAATGFTAVLPLIDTSGGQIGVLAIAYAPAAAMMPGSALARGTVIRDYLRLITPKRETLADPYMKGFDTSDTRAQRINQILVARHPDAATIAIHVTAPGDAKNKVWGINRPNFIGRDSDEIDTDTEKTGRVVMQVIPATHRMEVHMPLLSPEGKLIGTLCTVYFWRTLSEAADFYGRSLSMMEEVRALTPANRDDLFKP